jgi:hypothetical protein
LEPENLELAHDLEQAAASIRAIVEMRKRKIRMPYWLSKKSRERADQQGNEYAITLPMECRWVLYRIARCSFDMDTELSHVVRWVILLGLLHSENTIRSMNAWSKWRDAEGFNKGDSEAVIAKQLSVKA